MSTFIMGHGERVEGEATTFVPDGTRLRFYGDEGEELVTTAALAAVASGAGGTANETFEAGDEVWNYHPHKEDDLGIAQYMAIDPSGNVMVFCGPDLPHDTPCARRPSTAGSTAPTPATACSGGTRATSSSSPAAASRTPTASGRRHSAATTRTRWPTSTPR